MKNILYAIFLVILTLGLAGAALAAPSFTAEDLEFGSDNQDSGVDVSESLRLTNTGDTAMTLSLASNLPSDYNVRFSQSSVTLAAGSSTDVTVTIFIPSEDGSGRDEVSGGITVSSNVGGLSDNVRVFVTTEKMLEIYKVTIEIDGRERSLRDGESFDDDVSAGLTSTLRVYVRNNFDDNMEIEDIEVDVDSSGDLDLSESDEIGSLDDDDEDSLSFDIEIPSDAEDGDDYDIDIDVQGEDEDGNVHRDSFSTNIEVNREDHDLSITRATFSPSTLTCSGKVTMNLEIENIGRGSEDNVNILIENPELDIEQEFYLGDLDEDENVRKSFSFDITSSDAAGTYDFLVTTYYEVDHESNIETVPFTILACNTGSNSNNNGGSTGSNTNTGSNNNNVQPTVPPIVITGSGPSYGSASFTDSPAYVAILIAGVVVVAAILLILLVKFVF